MESGQADPGENIVEIVGDQAAIDASEFRLQPGVSLRKRNPGGSGSSTDSTGNIKEVERGNKMEKTVGDLELELSRKAEADAKSAAEKNLARAQQAEADLAKIKENAGELPDPDVAFTHYNACPNCKPKLDKIIEGIQQEAVKATIAGLPDSFIEAQAKARGILPEKIEIEIPGGK
jgi:hypothetical protein